MVEIGKLNKLKILKEVDFGVYLDGQELDEILLPKKYVPKNSKLNDIIEVFIYLDSNDRIIATTKTPYAMVGQFAQLKVVDVNSNGAFLNWGLPKDLLVPFREQDERMNQDKLYIVHIYLDNKSGRIVASSKINKFLDNAPIKYNEGQAVDLMICHEIPIGYKAIINNSHWGLIYKDEVYQPLRQGQLAKGFIKKIRNDDKIDLSLQTPGLKKINDLSTNILDLLNKHDGFLNITDKTSPEIIYKTFKVSKKTYKKAIGALYKRRLITIEKRGIKLK